MNRFVKLLLGLALWAMLVAVVPASGQDAAASDQPVLVMLSFDKSSVSEGIWEGTVTGDVSGSLRTELTNLNMVGPLWFVDFNWIIDAGEDSFTVAAQGTLNTLTGVAVMTGEVVEGAWLGATMYEQGQLVNPGTGRFAGTILLIDAAGGG